MGQNLEVMAREELLAFQIIEAEGSLRSKVAFKGAAKGGCREEILATSISFVIANSFLGHAPLLARCRHSFFLV